MEEEQTYLTDVIDGIFGEDYFYTVTETSTEYDSNNTLVSSIEVEHTLLKPNYILTVLLFGLVLWCVLKTLGGVITGVTSRR